jgi:hypothetical protein
MKTLLLSLLLLTGCNHSEPEIETKSFKYTNLKHCNYGSMEAIYSIEEYIDSPELVNSFDQLDDGNIVYGYCGFGS